MSPVRFLSPFGCSLYDESMNYAMEQADRDIYPLAIAGAPAPELQGCLPRYLELLRLLRHHWLCGSAGDDLYLGLSQYLAMLLNRMEALLMEAPGEQREVRCDELLDACEAHLERLKGLSLPSLGLSNIARNQLQPLDRVVQSVLAGYRAAFGAALEYLVTEQSDFLARARCLNSEAYVALAGARRTVAMAFEQLLDLQRGAPLFVPVLPKSTAPRERHQDNPAPGFIGIGNSNSSSHNVACPPTSTNGQLECSAGLEFTLESNEAKTVPGPQQRHRAWATAFQLNCS